MVGTASGQMHPVEKESSIHFAIKNFGFNTNGSLAAPTEIFLLIRMICPNLRSVLPLNRNPSIRIMKTGMNTCVMRIISM